MFAKGTGQSLNDYQQPYLQPCKAINKKALSQFTLCPDEVCVKARVHPNNKRNRQQLTHFSLNTTLAVK